MKYMIWLLSTAAVVGASSAVIAGNGSIKNSPHYIQTAAPARADMGGLIGHSVETPQGDRIGTVNGVFASKDGKISNVIVGLGMPLSMSNRDVALSWKQLQFADGGKKVVVNMTKDQIKALPDYKMPDTGRGSVMTEAPQKTATATTKESPMKEKFADAKEKAVETKDKVVAKTKDMMKDEPLTTSAGTEVGKLIGTNVENRAGDRIGEVDAVFLDKTGKVDSVIVGVGGFLGVGEHDVALKWSSLSITPDGSKVVVDATKDQLKSMQAYHYAQPDYRGAVFGYYGP